MDTGAQRVKKILHKEKLHFLVSFSFETQFEVHQNDPEQVFEGDIFAQTVQSHNGVLLINTVSTHYCATYLNWGT